MLNRIQRRLRAIVRHSALDREMREEMAAHLAQSTERFMARGMSRADAEREARREFGNVGVLQEEGRDARRTGWIDATVADLRFALRHFARRRMFALCVVLVLSLGLGANAALFSLLQAITMRPAPGVPDDPRLVRIRGIERAERGGRRTMRGLSVDELRALRGEKATFAMVGAWATDQVVLDMRDRTEPSPEYAQFVTPDFFAALGIAPELGPGLARSELPDHSVIIGNDLWERQFGGSRAAIGRIIDVNGVPLRIAGVAPARFLGPVASGTPSLWIPLSVRPAMHLDSASLSAIARLAPGKTLAWASAVALHVAQIHPAVAKIERTADVVRLRGETDLSQQEQARTMSAGFAIIALLTLLVTCTNVSALLVGAAVARRQEIAIRLSLGASRGRVIRQLLTESALLSLAGGIAGLILYAWIVRLIASQTPGHDLAPDLLTAAGTMVFAIATGMLFGLSPALHATRRDVAGALRDSAAATTTRSRLQRVFVVAQIVLTQPMLVVLAMMLVVVAPQSAKSPSDPRLLRVRFGIWDDRRVTGPRERQAAELMRRLATEPGIAAAVPDAAGFANVNGVVPTAERAGDGVRRGESTLIHLEGAAPGYFAALGVPIVRGRDVEWSDTSGRAAAVVIGSDFARTLWGSADPIGRHISAAVPGSPGGDDAIVVVGVFDQKVSTTRGADQRAFTAFGQHWRRDQFFVRTTGPASAHLSDVKTFLRSSPALPLLALETLVDVDRGIRDDAFHVSLGAAGAGALALLLASIGLYGVVALAVGQRKREIGIRVALGASPVAVALMFFRSGLVLSVLGLVIGLPISLVGVGALVQFVDAPAIGTVTMAAAISAVVLSVAAIATWIPARRATTVDAAITLRAD